MQRRQWGSAAEEGWAKLDLTTADVWAQDKLRACDFSLARIPGVDNPADILTKYVERPLLQKHLNTLRLYVEEGRPESAPLIAQHVLQLQYGVVQIASL